MTAAYHYAVPFRFIPARGGGVQEEQRVEGSTEQIADCLELTLRTVQGQRQTLPRFGRPDNLEFGVDPALVVTQIAQAMDDAEPRARAIVQGDYDPYDHGTQRILAMWALREEEPS